MGGAGRCISSTSVVWDDMLCALAFVHLRVLTGPTWPT